MAKGERLLRSQHSQLFVLHFPMLGYVTFFLLERQSFLIFVSRCYFSAHCAHVAVDELNRKILFGKTLDLELVRG